MPEDISDVILDRVKHFTIGFGRAGDTPAAKGSGVLIKRGNVFGILTCAHVDTYLREQRQPIGLVRLNRGLAQQAGTLNLDEMLSYAAGQDPWTEEDLAFIHVPTHLVGNIERDCTFLDFDRNLTKPEPDENLSLIQAHSVFGLVEEFTGATTRRDGRATTLLKGVLTSGILSDLNAPISTLECFKENLPDLPTSFGGTSGGGLWRVYVHKREDGNFEAVHHRLLGIACREIRETPPRIMCQGLAPMQLMLEGVRRKMSGETD